MKVLGMGNALVDIITRLDNDAILESFGLPKGSMTLVDSETSTFVNNETRGLEKQKASGGSAANTIHGLAHLGIECAFVGKVGDDDLGQFFYKDMKSKKINPILFKSIRDTGRAIALISSDSERTFATYLGAAVELSTQDLDSHIYEGYDLFYVEGYLVQDHKLIEKAMKLAKNNGLKVIIDLASFNVVADHRDFFLQIIKEYVDIVFANELEAESLTGEKPEQAINTLGDMTEIAVIKLGEEGSLIHAGEETVKVGIRPANPIDTTGAGDLYAAGFLYGYLQNMSFKHCGEIGAMLSSKVIEVNGAKLAEATWEKLRREIAAL